MISRKKIPDYIKNLVKKNSKIASGRKNFDEHQFRIIETIKLVKKYFNIKSK